MAGIGIVRFVTLCTFIDRENDVQSILRKDFGVFLFFKNKNSNHSEWLFDQPYIVAYKLLLYFVQS